MRAAVLLVSCAAALAASEAPAFSKKPTAARKGDKVVIEFTVTRETDVSVFIEDGKGGVIRHLASGVLGKNPPKPLKANSLAQSIEWDGKADWGKAAPSGTHQVRVALGMGVAYDRIIAGVGVCGGRPKGIGIGPDGTLYLSGDAGSVVGWGTQTLYANNADGSYQRTLIPVPADASKERLAFLGSPSVDVDGRPAPIVVDTPNRRTTAFYPEKGGGMAVTAEGHVLVPVDGRVCLVPASNTLPAGGFGGEKITAAGKGCDFSTGSAMVIASDGKSVFVSGMEISTGKGKPGTPVPAVFRVKLPERTQIEVVCGDPAVGGNDEKHLATPYGMTLDGKGNLLIADRDNNRIVAVSEKDGKFVGALAVEHPEAIACDTKTGSLYIAQPAGHGAANLLKYGGWKDGKEVARAQLAPAKADKYLWNMVCFGGGKTPVIYAAHTRLGLFAFEDNAGKLAPRAAQAAPQPQTPSYQNQPTIGLGNMAFYDLQVDHYRKDPEIYIRTTGGDAGYGFARYVETSGKWEPYAIDGKFVYASAGGFCLVPGPDGNIYTLGFPCNLMRFSHEGPNVPWTEPNPFPSGPVPLGVQEKYFLGKNNNKGSAYSAVDMVYMTHHLGIRPDGHVFVFEHTVPSGSKNGKTLFEYDLSGKKIGQAPIWKVSDACIGPRFDQDGNFYLLEQVHPKEQLVPPEFTSFIGPVDGKTHWPAGDVRGNVVEGYGSVVKFSPKGGTIDCPNWRNAFDGEMKLDPSLKSADGFACLPHSDRQLIPTRIVGAEWVRMGVSHIEFPQGICNCENTRFDVDPFGRVWYPDLFRYRVEVLDTNGNEIMHYGAYGNADSIGPESKDKKLAKPEIAFSWLIGVGATDKYAYMADSNNFRLMRAKITYAAEETCAAH